MVIIIEPCSDADLDRAFHIVSDAFQHAQPVVDAIFPAHDTPQGHAHGRNGLLQSKQTDPTAHFIKAVNQDTGGITGIAKWLVLQGQAAQPLWVGKSSGSDEEKEYAEHLVSEYQKLRSEAIKSMNGHLLTSRSLSQASCAANSRSVLDLLAVDPRFQRRGAGSLLVKWGTDHADQLGLEVRSLCRQQCFSQG